jgi:hypothetical protein
MTVKTYQLKQQTPMIHFQSDEYGATLRTSEVKPKLDRFLLMQLGGAEAVRNANPHWFVSSEHDALNYKMRFSAAKSSKTFSIPYSIFYANMGKERRKSPLKMVVGDCSMTIVCFIPMLVKKIEESLADFFMATTFGFMQGKGFGGYILGEKKPSQEQVARAVRMVWGCGKVYSVTTMFPKIVCEKTANVFDNIIKPFHGLMKSGINFGGYYERSYLFQYFHNHPNIHYGNDKAFVKSKGIAPVVYKKANATKGEHIHPASEYKYIRALLGISEKIEYIHALGPDNKPLKGSDGKVKKDVVTIKSSGDIERYASPVRYRVIGNQVYVFAVPISEKLYGQQFVFTSSTGENTISMPDRSDFDIECFLSAFIQHINENSNARIAARFNKNEKFEEVRSNS